MATSYQEPRNSLWPQSSEPFMTAISRVGSAMPAGPLGTGRFGLTARMSPVTTVIPDAAVSMKRMPVYRLYRSKTSRARCFWFSVIALKSGLPWGSKP